MEALQWGDMVLVDVAALDVSADGRATPCGLDDANGDVRAGGAQFLGEELRKVAETLGILRGGFRPGRFILVRNGELHGLRVMLCHDEMHVRIVDGFGKVFVFEHSLRASVRVKLKVLGVVILGVVHFHIGLPGCHKHIAHIYVGEGFEQFAVVLHFQLIRVLVGWDLGDLDGELRFVAAGHLPGIPLVVHGEGCAELAPVDIRICDVFQFTGDGDRLTALEYHAVRIVCG